MGSDAFSPGRGYSCHPLLSGTGVTGILRAFLEECVLITRTGKKGVQMGARVDPSVKYVIEAGANFFASS
jgi:hypothetical protein